jgi:Ca2+-dependent lipid-binding protein
MIFEKVMGGAWEEVGRTEMLVNTLNPSWKSKFLVDFRFHERQVVRFDVYDWDKKSHKIKKQDYLARLECSLGTIVSGKSRQYISAPSDGPSKRAKFIISAEEVTANNDILNLQLAASGLDDKDKFGKSDPYYVISKSTGGPVWAVVAKSEFIKNTLNPTWKPMSIPIRELCNGEYDRKLKVDVYDWDSNGDHDWIGTFTTTLRDLQMGMSQQKMFPCINPKKLSKKKYTDSGKVFLKQFSIQERNSPSKQ